MNKRFWEYKSWHSPYVNPNLLKWATTALYWPIRPPISSLTLFSFKSQKMRTFAILSLLAGLVAAASDPLDEQFFPVTGYRCCADATEDIGGHCKAAGFSAYCVGLVSYFCSINLCNYTWYSPWSNFVYWTFVNTFSSALVSTLAREVDVMIPSVSK